MDKFLGRIVWFILIIPAIYLAIVWNKLPEKVAMHFGWEGKPDRYGQRSELLLATVLMVAMGGIIYLILTNIYRIDPKKYAAENKTRLRRLAFGVVVFITAVLCMVIYSASSGNVRFSTGLILAGTGLLFAFIGNYLPNLKPNYFAGLRLPWTLENEENWRKTHALAGKLWFIGGLFLAIVCAFLPPKAAMIVFIAVTLTITIIPMVYSYLLFARLKRSSSSK
jgi:uncharacterized membrane protein